MVRIEVRITRTNTPTKEDEMQTLTLPFRAAHSRMRRRIGTAGAVAVWLVGTSAVVALAAVLILARMSGSFTVVGAPTMRFTGTPTVSTDGSGLNCKATTTGGQLNLTITNALPGSTCTVTTSLLNDSTTTELKVQGIDAGALKVTTGDAYPLCGRSVDKTGVATPITLKFTIPETAQYGTTSLPSSAGVTAVPSGQYDASACTLG